MEKIIEKLFDLKKIPTKLIFIIWICTGVILFVPKQVLLKLNLEDFIKDFGKFIGIIFLITSAFLLVSIISYIASKIQYKKTKLKIEKDILEEITKLGFHEIVLLREFYINQKDALQLPMDNDTVASLQNKRILYQVSGTGFTYLHGAYFTYSITEFAKKNINAEMLGLTNNLSEDEKKRIILERPKWAKEKQYFENR